MTCFIYMANNRFFALLLAMLFTLCAPSVAIAEEAVEETEAEPAPAPSAIDLGFYSLRDVRSAEDEKFRLNFALQARVEPDKLYEMEQFQKKSEHRIREQVLIAVRLSESKDFQEPKLMRLKRRIMMRLKRVLPNLEIQELYISEFGYFVD